MALTNDFMDVKELPKATVKATDGSSVEISYARHCVVSNDAFDNSPFLKALQANGLWDQQSFKINGVALAVEIGGITATRVDASQRALVGTATHTGGHDAYNAAQKKIFVAFNGK